MKAYNFNVRALHAICFVLALVLLVAGLQAFFVANAATQAGAASVYPDHAIAKMAGGLFLGACAWFDALEKPCLGEANDARLAMAKSDLAQSAQRVASAWDEASKSASVNQASGSGSSCTSSAQHDPAERHRARLEELAMHSLATAALPHEERFTPKEAGARLREAMDALIGCNCGPNEACANCPSHTEATATAGKHKRLWPLEPHQLRVLEEHEELDERLRKLMNFMGNPQFNDLPDAEKDLLRQQSEHMQAYASVLHKRINAFYKLSTL